MADDKSKVGWRDRAKVAGGEDYEVEYIARELGVTTDAVRNAIAKVGNSREKIEAELKGNSDGTQP